VSGHTPGDQLDLDAILRAADPTTPVAWPQSMRDQAFVIHAREDVPALVAEVRRLREVAESASREARAAVPLINKANRERDEAEAEVRRLRAQVERLWPIIEERNAQVADAWQQRDELAATVERLEAEADELNEWVSGRR
jgi:peptidoglycan hydrolase CwlO-like protein